MTGSPSWAKLGRRAERPSFADVAERHYGDVYAYLVYLTRDRAAAEDLTVETFEKALGRWRRFDARRASAKTWLCTIARSAALDHFRAEQTRRRREQAYVAQQRDVEDAPVVGLAPELERALGALSRGEREVIALRVVLEFDTAATARVLGISRTACTTRLSRALEKLEAEVKVCAIA
jgi:RNA polymerase sigma-70 factor (ECF subfamily)